MKSGECITDILIMKIIKKIFGYWLFGFFGVSVFVIAFFLRLYNLTRLPIFVDEAIYVRWAQVMKAESTLRFLPLSDGKQPLYMWSVIPFLKVFSDPLFAGRFVSVITGMATLIGVAYLSYLLFRSKKITLISAFLYAISPYSVFFDRMALADSMLSMFGIWSVIFAVLVIRTMRVDLAMILGFSLGGSLLTKSPALFFQILLPFSAILISWPKTIKENMSKVIRLIFLFIVSNVISQIMFNILRLGPNFHLLKSRNYDYVYPIGHVFENFVDPFVPHLNDVLGWIRYFGPALLLPLIIFGLIMGIKKHCKETIFFAILIFVPVLAQCMYAKVFTARYLYFVIPYILILSSLTFLIKSKLLNLCLYFILILYSFFALKQDYYLLSNPGKMALPRGERTGYLEEWTAGQGIYEASIYLRNEYVNNKNKKIVVGTDGYFGTLPDGLQIYLNDIPQITIVGVEVRFFEIPKPLLESYGTGNKTYLLVNSSRFYIKNPELVGLKLIESYSKAIKPDGTQESLLFFEIVASKS